MSVTLHVDLNTPAEDLEPATALSDLRAVLRLLKHMEAALERADDFDATAWRFRSLEVASLHAAFAATSPDTKRPRAVALALVHGFRDAEATNLIPDGWSAAAATTAGNIASHLSDDPSRGLRLRVVVDGEDQADAEVTAAAGKNLRAATRATTETIGSVVGTVGSLSVRGSTHAGIWPERGGGRVRVAVGKDRLDDISGALGKRVRIGGRLARNTRGQLLRIKMRTLEVLPTLGLDGDSHLTGIAPDITGGLDPIEYLRRVRESS